MSSIECRKSGAGTVWRVRWREDGRNKAMTFTGEAGARKWKSVLDAVGPTKAREMLTAAPTDERTVAEQVHHHIDHLTGVTEGTRKTYRSYTRRLGPIADLPLSALDRAAVARWINHLEESLSGKSIANHHGLLSAAMASAVADHLIPENPCHRMRLPRSPAREMVFLTRTEYEELHGLLTPRYQPLALTLVGTGMRWGEATALQVRDLDLAGRSIRVHQAWKMTGSSERLLGVPKTSRSNRTVALPPPLVDVLADVTAGRKGAEFVFTNAHGRPVKQATFWLRHWSVAVQQFAGDTVRVGTDRSGRPTRHVVETGDGKHPRIHDLRHTFASWAISAGVPLPVLQRQLGHESITTTVDRYGHLARSDFDALAEATAANLRGIPLAGNDPRRIST